MYKIVDKNCILKIVRFKQAIIKLEEDQRW